MSSPDRRPLRVLICDAEPLVRRGLQAVLDTGPDVAVAGELDSAGPVPASVGRLNVDVVLLGSSLLGPPVDGQFPLLAGLVPRVQRPVILIADTDEMALVSEAIRAGVRGFLGRRTADRDLLLAVATAAGGEAFLSPSLTEALFGRMTALLHRPAAPVRADLAGLSPRELEVLGLMGHGRTNDEISAELGIRNTTVRSHVAHILTKLQLHARTEAVLIGYEARIDPPA